MTPLHRGQILKYAYTYESEIQIGQFIDFLCLIVALSLQDALHREQMLENKLATLQRLVQGTQEASENGWQVRFCLHISNRVLTTPRGNTEKSEYLFKLWEKSGNLLTIDKYCIFGFRVFVLTYILSRKML